MKYLVFTPLFFFATLAIANPPNLPSSRQWLHVPPQTAADFTITTSDGQVKQLYQDYINQQKLVVIEAFFTTCPPCATHAPLVQNLYTSMQATHPGKVEFLLLSTLFNDTNAKVAQYKTSKGLSMPGVGKDGGSITALQPYLNGQFGPFQGTPTFIVIAPGSGVVTFDIRGLSPNETIMLLQQKIEAFFPKDCTLKSPFGTPLETVQIGVNAPVFDTLLVANGAYDLSNVIALKNTTCTIKPHKTGSITGLTTYDLVLISKHILGIEPFKCPWQILAADVNCTGSVTTFDIVTARKVILGILDSLPCGSWRFMPDSATVSNGACQDFVGVILGDVNAGPCNDSLATSAESRFQPRNLFLNEHDFQPGETAQVSLFFVENTELNGLQFVLDFDPDLINIQKIETEMLEDFDAGSYHLTNQHLALSWIRAQRQQFSATTTLLRFDVTAPKGGKLSELLRFSESGLHPEAYSTDGQIHPLQLAWIPPASDYSISPNPARNLFTLKATAKQDGDLLVQMLDLQGKIVLAKTLPAFTGFNSWEIETSTTPSGFYFLKVNGRAAGVVVVGQ